MVFQSVTLLSTVFVFVTDSAKEQKEIRHFLGTWTIVSVQSGNSLGSQIFKKGNHLSIEETSMTYWRPTGTNQGSFQIDRATVYPSIDFSSGAFRTNRGVYMLDSWIEIHGIYELHRDCLKMCFVFECDADFLPKPRPTDFAVSPNKDRVLLVLHRENSKEDKPGKKASGPPCRRSLGRLR